MIKRWNVSKYFLNYIGTRENFDIFYFTFVSFIIDI